MYRSVNGFQMAYSAGGAGQPMLFVHGYPLNRQIWTPQLDNLADSGYIIAPDLRGHGESDPVPGPYSMDLLADDLNALLDRLEVRKKVILCGLSMGGYVALAFWRKYASRLKALILTATRAAPDSPEAQVARDQAAATVRQSGIEPIVVSMLPRLLAPETLRNNPALAKQLGAIMRSTSSAGVLGDLAGMRDRPDSRPDLKNIELPTLILHGQEDQIVPVQEAQEMFAALPNSRLRLIPHAGHLPNLEQPARFNAAIREFITNFNL